ncbi:hypothetical protein [Streptomyces sp. NPDC058495]|uniref:hypothetical protein n=1 Tax=unclassified Streptomyces TaxID=2593676 RepID=UPI0036547813
MTTPARRSLGDGPRTPIRATEADLVRDLPGIGFPDLNGLRARGVLGPPPTRTPGRRRRALGVRAPEAAPQDERSFVGDG